jgi:hypothetical protein
MTSPSSGLQEQEKQQASMKQIACFMLFTPFLLDLVSVSLKHVIRHTHKKLQELKHYTIINSTPL